jgi:chromatin segregation and condensation protein Rec8/ScpA/Scc1 (kleisin family)
MRRLAVEPASEFLVMAATLMQIKSALLLPRPPLDPDDPDDGSARPPRGARAPPARVPAIPRGRPRARPQHPRAGRDVFFRTPGIDRPPDPEDEQDLANQDIFRLAEAFRRLIAKGRFTAPHDIHVERISIAERIAQIAEILARDQSGPTSRPCSWAPATARKPSRRSSRSSKWPDSNSCASRRATDSDRCGSKPGSGPSGTSGRTPRA